MNFEVKRITNGPKHHLFGFHDLVQTNAKGDLALTLEIDDISHPPLPGESCLSGIVPAGGGEFIPVHKTHTWNYPQGARQQWIGESDLFVCNDRDENNKLVCRVSDARERHVVETLPFPVHCLNAQTRKTFGLNYDRIHACGGYGYTPGLLQKCPRKINDIPDDDGIFIGDLDSRKSELLVSIVQVAACGEIKPVRTGYPHYLTHLMLNPSGRRIAFLHRYRVPDGGETTRLMTIGVDGAGLRCLAKGSLSHFTWISDDEVFIWGKDERALSKMRESACLRIPGVLQAAMLAKRMIRVIRGVNKTKSNVDSKVQDRAFLVIKDNADQVTIGKDGIGVLIEDGHPMAQPGNLHWLVSDTYPDPSGKRWLYFYDVSTKKRYDVAQFQRLFAVPDIQAFDWRFAEKGLDIRIARKFDRDDYLFYRSGYHTDLHPRWGTNGMAYFDSIHEGSRQVYMVSVMS